MAAMLIQGGYFNKEQAILTPLKSKAVVLVLSASSEPETPTKCVPTVRIFGISFSENRLIARHMSLCIALQTKSAEFAMKEMETLDGASVQISTSEPLLENAFLALPLHTLMRMTCACVQSIIIPNQSRAKTRSALSVHLLETL